jgi:hypothetical protein
LDTPGAHEDVTSTLTDLERKLVDLERELQTVAGEVPAPIEIVDLVPLAPDPPVPETEVRIDDLRGQIAELVQFRAQLQSAAQELVDEFGRLVERLQGGEGAVRVPTRAPQAAEPAIDAADPPEGADAPQEGGEGAASTFDGEVVVDAGPFGDIATLSSFERALTEIPGAEDVYVRSFEGDRAVIDLRLQASVPLVEELKTRLSLPITVREARDGRLSVDVGAESHGT